MCWTNGKIKEREKEGSVAEVKMSLSRMWDSVHEFTGFRKENEDIYVEKEDIIYDTDPGQL